MLRGLVDAYHAFGESAFLELGLKNANFIYRRLLHNGKLLRSHGEKINGYLEDYALVIDAFIALYQASFDEQWLDLARKLTDYTIENFYDSGEELFYFTDKNAENLIARKKEIFDNVIPASNSVMAQNLYWLGKIFEKEEYINISRHMISKLAPLLMKESRYVANWGTLYALLCKPTAEIAIIGTEYQAIAREIQTHYIPGKLIVAASDGGGDCHYCKTENQLTEKQHCMFVLIKAVNCPFVV